jgi:hypothetical protein
MPSIAEVKSTDDGPTIQVPGIPLVLLPGSDAGDAAPLVVRIEVPVQADGAVDTARSTSFLTNPPRSDIMSLTDISDADIYG